MKRITLPVVFLLAMHTFLYAGGNISPKTEILDTVGSTLNPFYIGLGYSSSKHSIAPDDIKPKGITLIAGYELNPHLSIEGRYSKYTKKVTYFVPGPFQGTGEYITADFKTSNLALFVKPSYAIENFKVYGLLGYGKYSYRYASTANQSKSGFQWGVGGSYDLNDKFTIFTDYTVMYHNKADAWTAGLLYKF